MLYSCEAGELTGEAASNAFLKALAEVIQLPDHMIECKLELKLDEPVLLTCKYHPVVDNKLLEGLTVSGRYRLQSMAQIAYTRKLEETID